MDTNAAAAHTSKTEVQYYRPKHSLHIGVKESDTLAESHRPSAPAAAIFCDDCLGRGHTDKNCELLKHAERLRDTAASSSAQAAPSP